jgi:GNAT superfamily N-acetyltransferase
VGRAVLADEPAREAGDVDHGLVSVAHVSLLSCIPASIHILGFDVISVHRSYLQGHLLYLLPEHRGQGVVPAYFDAVTRHAGRLGLDGFFFASTLDRWRRNHEGFTIGWKFRQHNGPEVTSYWRSAWTLSAE